MARDYNEVATQPEKSGWTGWVYFAAFMMTVMGVFQILIGLTALLNDRFYAAANGHLVVFDFTHWGWVHLLFGIVVLMAGTSLFSGHTWARVVAMILATLNLLLQFAFVSAYPVWSIIVMVVDIIIIYALTVHGGELKRED